MKKAVSLILILILALSVTLYVAAVGNDTDEVPDSVYTGDYDLQDICFEAYRMAKESGATQFDIYTADQLYALVSLINSSEDGFSGCTISLKCNLIYNTGSAADWTQNPPSCGWSPIGSTTSHPFKGTFDGEGHTISGLWCKQDTLSAFVGVADGAVIKNLGIVNSLFHSGSGGYTASFVAQMRNTGSSVVGCYSDAVIIDDTFGAGGIVALVYAPGCTISECAFSGTINAKNTAGGILGLTNMFTNSVTPSAIVSDCVNFGAVHTSSLRSAGICGMNDIIKLERCINFGTVTSDKTSDDGVKIFDNASIFGTFRKDDMSDVQAIDCYIFSDLNQLVHGIGEDKTSDAKYSAPGYWDQYIKTAVSTSVKSNGAADVLTEFDFDNVWTASENDYPVPQAAAVILAGVENQAEPSISTGDNSEESTTDISEPTVTTSYVTTSAATTGETTLDSGDTSDKENEKSGCGSMITGFSVAAVILAAGAGALVSKKRK